MDDRLYPTRPILAASTAVFRDGRVLIARRARAPMAGVYSLPGGAVELVPSDSSDRRGRWTKVIFFRGASAASGIRDVGVGTMRSE